MMSIRKASPQDAEVISSIGKTSFEQAHPQAAPPDILSTYLANKFDAKTIEQELSDDKNLFHVVSYNLSEVGFSKIQFDVENSFVSASRIAKLERLYLLQEVHGKRIGQLFYEYIEELAISEGQSGFWLTVWVNNFRAIRFYEKNGFTIVGETQFSLSEGYSNPNHVMLKHF